MATESMRTAGASRAGLYVHPDCSKSRSAVELLQARGAEFERRDYLARPLDAGELHALIAALGAPAVVLLRIDDARRQGLVSAAEPADDVVIDLLQTYPALM